MVNTPSSELEFYEKIHRFESPLKVIPQLWKGKSLTRALFNLAISRHTLRGRVLDLGSKSGTSSYYDYIKMEPGVRITYTDIVPGPDVIEVDIEKTLPFEEETFDTVIAFHLLEHVYNLEKIPAEVLRILKPGGTLIVAVPFLYEYHGDPHDYWRMTDQAVHRIFTSVCFETRSIESVGEGLATFAGTKIFSQMLPSFLKPFGLVLGYCLTTGLDRFINRFARRIDGRYYSERFGTDIIGLFMKPVTIL